MVLVSVALMAMGLTACLPPQQVVREPEEPIPPIQLETPIMSFRANTHDTIVEWTMPSTAHEGFINGYWFEVLNNSETVVYRRYFSYSQDLYFNMTGISQLQRHSVYNVRVHALGGWFDYDVSQNQMVEVFDSQWSTPIAYHTEFQATVTNVRLERIQNYVFFAFETNMEDIKTAPNPAQFIQLIATGPGFEQGAFLGNDITLAGNIPGAQRYWIMLTNGSTQRSEWPHAMRHVFSTNNNNQEFKYHIFINGRAMNQHGMSANVGNRWFHDSGYSEQVSFTKNLIETPRAVIDHMECRYTITWDVQPIIDSIGASRLPRYFSLEFVGRNPNNLEQFDSRIYRFFDYGTPEHAEAMASGQPNVGSFQIVNGKITIDVRDLNPEFDYLAPYWQGQNVGSYYYFVLVGFAQENIFENNTLHIFGGFNNFNDVPSNRRVAIHGIYDLFFANMG